MFPIWILPKASNILYLLSALSLTPSWQGRADHGLRDLISIGYGVFKVTRLASYLPQIAAVLRDLHGARAISISWWSIARVGALIVEKSPRFKSRLGTDDAWPGLSRML